MVGSGPRGGGTSCRGGQGPAPRTPQAAVSAATWVHGTRPPQRGARSPPWWSRCALTWVWTIPSCAGRRLKINLKNRTATGASPKGRGRTVNTGDQTGRGLGPGCPGPWIWASGWECHVEPPAARYEEETQRLRVRPLATAPTVRRGQGSQAAPQRPLNREGGGWPPDPSGPEGEPAHTGARGTERSPQAAPARAARGRVRAQGHGSVTHSSLRRAHESAATLCQFRSWFFRFLPS